MIATQYTSNDLFDNFICERVCACVCFNCLARAFCDVAQNLWSQKNLQSYLNEDK